MVGRLVAPIAALVAVGTLLFEPTMTGRVAASLGAPTAARVAGRVIVLERGNAATEDLSGSVVWLETGRNVRVTPATVEVTMSDKEFRPHLVVVPVGSTVSFPNHDPFDHNVFSRSDAGPFDLGLYDRGESRNTVFRRPGIVRIYCNVHSQMSAIVVVRDNPYYAQPRADGTFQLPDVLPGEYTLHAWHERAAAFVPQALTVGVEGTGDLIVELDARAYEFEQHLNKYGQPYSQIRRGRRY